MAGFILVFVFGTLIGSFLNVLAWRLPRGQRPTGRSRCPKCRTVLGARDLVPIVSYLFYGRRCRHCREPISPRYLVIELATGLLFAAAWTLAPTDLLGYAQMVRIWFIIAVLVVVFVIDLEHFLILDKVIYPASLVILAANVIMDAWRGSWLMADHTLGGIVAALILSGSFYLLWSISGGKWIGLGDAKLAVFLGFALGFPVTFVAVFLAFFLGTMVAIPLLATSQKTLKSEVPLGTFLSAAAMLCLFFGQAILDWYLRAVGLY